MHRPQLYPATILITSLFLSIASPVQAQNAYSRVQELVATAYYSPLPDQDRYALGSYEEDIAFNGAGIRGNDGTPVYPGMLAAPPEFPFGTLIELPGYGVVGTVHDRGGAIQVGEDGLARIDLWMGHGEEGLRRALEWGSQRVEGIVYMPANAELPTHSFDLAKFDAPEKAIAHLPKNPIPLFDINHPGYGDTSAQVALIQHALQTIGYFDHDVTRFFGDVTRAALASFQRDMGVGGDGTLADDATRSVLVAHREIEKELTEPLPSEDILLSGRSGKEIRVLQRMLKLLGRYEGETNGLYDDALMSSVFQFQRDKNIVGSLTDVGAGMLGPQTRRALLTAWRDHRIAKRGGGTMVAGIENQL
jgi:peptidoglycan hydrolase-like protein with peptidoglycan-binding domain/3D (Asp-Asp-Asp) domain-containing protein